MVLQNPYASPELGIYVGGMIPSPHDPRDYVYAANLRATAGYWGNHDLRDYKGQSLATSVRNQGQVGACTGFAWASTRASATARWHVEQGSPPDVRAPSPRFLYHLERVEFMDPPTFPQDSGATMRSGGDVMVKYGCALEEYCPYTETANDPPPSQEAFDSGAFYGISTYYRIPGSGQGLIDGMLRCLDEGWPMAIAINVYPSFEMSPGNGRIPMPRFGEYIRGGHAITVFGNFIDNSFDGGGCFVVQNSWGTTWGDGGWCYIPFGYALRAAPDGYGAPLVEAWTIR